MNVHLPSLNGSYSPVSLLCFLLCVIFKTLSILRDGISINHVYIARINALLKSLALLEISSKMLREYEIEIVHLNTLGEPQPSTQQIFPKSTLVYTLNETLHDAAALAYFIQFMEGIGTNFFIQ